MWKRNKFFRYGGIALIIIGAIVIAYPFYTNFVMTRQEARVLDAWDEYIISSEKTPAEEITSTVASDQEIAETDATTITSVEESIQEDTGAVITAPEELFILDPSKKVPFKIIIPKIGVEWLVHEGTDIPSLKRGPGHYPGTSLPGEIGLCIIAGHRTTYGAPFNRVDQLDKGDEIILQTASNENFIYYVTGLTETKPDDVSVLNQTNYPSLALTTCHPKYHASKRLIVFADMIDY